jgi:hypothetical protein
MKTDALAAKIAARILRRQTKIAGYLNHKTQHWNRASKFIALLIFCLLSGSICLYFMIKSI